MSRNRQSVGRSTVLEGVDRMTAELVNVMPFADAIERARNMAQALQDGYEDPVEVAREALSGRLGNLTAGERIIVISRAAAAWTSTVQTHVYRETEPTPLDCPTCGGSGGGPDRPTRCPHCRGTGLADSDEDEGRDEAEATADYMEEL